MTLTEGRSFEEVAPGDIDKALERQRREEANGGSAVVRASVANLVVVTANRAAGQRALAAVEDLGARAPSRCVVLIAEPPEGRPGVRSWARVVRRRPEGGPELVWEEVVVQTNVHPRHLTAVVLPLLLPELPVFTWWEGTPPFADEVFDELTSVTDRLIVDSASFVDPVADLARLAKAAAVLEAAVSDCAWGRLTPWRDLLAAPFGGPPLRDAVDSARWLRVDAVEPTAGLELIGWFASRLGWELDGVRVGARSAAAAAATASAPPASATSCRSSAATASSRRLSSRPPPWPRPAPGSGPPCTRTGSRSSPTRRRWPRRRRGAPSPTWRPRSRRTGRPPGC
jgi:glucose-6-phosphate dehydrogenase assembly protein OpcA